MAIFPDLEADAIYLSQTNPDEPLSAFSAYAFHLDGHEWPTVTHYFQAMKFDDEALQARIRQAPSAKKARGIGRSRLRKPRADWSSVRTTVMTRAIYTRCRTHDDVATALLDTGERQLMESNAYDYFWGCGRDRRGQNEFGKALMNVRAKLRAEQTSD
ncbi:N-glycosidase [BD1-7 clade bacterium]|uniref:N-glycosidase n=1 Tax=BD1-7 clade bacterium TaxID=2029982 RepID=A0A5S9N2J3_9GAMM|nr:N-glycosidase [BD1-7 clade bacterium]CAA0083654.1 N-glycosidase [BD1-7 clade bacterium]